MGERSPKASDDERAAAELLAPLRVDPVVMSGELKARTMHRIHTAISAKELIELTTSVFVLRVCAPALDILIRLIRPTGPKRR